MRAVLPKPLPGLILERRGGSRESLLEMGILAAIAALSYGPFLPSLGYYWDDWRILWVGSGHSPTNILENYAYRPGTAWLFYALDRSMGTNHFLAQCLALAARALSALTLWGIVRLVWRPARTAAFAAAALYLVYPGFTQQSISLTYQNYHVGILICFVSIYASLYLFREGMSRTSAVAIFLVSLATEVMYLLVLDGLVVLEAMRWALILVLAARYTASAAGALALGARRATPYVLTVIGFVVWRGVFVKATRDDVNLSAVLRAWRSMSPGQLATMVPGQILSNILDSCVFAWSVPAWRGIGYREKVLVFGIGVAAAGAALAYLRLRRWPAGERPRSWARGFVLVGGATLLVISLFQCATRKNISLDGDSSRFAYPASAATALLVVGLAGSCLGRRASIPVVTLLVGLSVLSNFAHAYTYKRLWAAERSLMWQLAWRAPDIEPGTLVVVARARQGIWLEDLPISHDINGPLNLHFTNGEPPLLGMPLNGLSIDLVESIGAGRRDRILDRVRTRLKEIYDDVPGMRVQEPPGVLLMFQRYPEATLRVVDPDHVDELPEHTEESRLAEYVRVDLIRGSGRVGVPTDRLVGEEPPHGWAWYFQRAELARQFGHRDELGRLVKDVVSKRLAPEDPSEWFVFLEGAIRSGDHEAASWIVQQAASRDESFLPNVKTWLERFADRAGAQEKAFAASIAAKLPEASGREGERESRPDR